VARSRGCGIAWLSTTGNHRPPIAWSRLPLGRSKAVNRATWRRPSWRIVRGKARVCQRHCPLKPITWPRRASDGGRCLVAIEPKSNRPRLEQEAPPGRIKNTWHALMERRKRSGVLCVGFFFFSRDPARSGHTIDQRSSAGHAGDVRPSPWGASRAGSFHGQHTAGQAVSGPLATKPAGGGTADTEEQERLPTRTREPAGRRARHLQQRAPGRPPKSHRKTGAARQEAPAARLLDPAPSGARPSRSRRESSHRTGLPRGRMRARR